VVPPRSVDTRQPVAGAAGNRRGSRISVFGVQRLSTAQAARVAGIDAHNAWVMVPRLARAISSRDAVPRITWSAGEVVAMAVVRALDPHAVHPERWAAGAVRVGEAHERGLCPAYLVTAGASDYAILLDDDGAERAAIEVLARLAASDCVVRVVPITPIVEYLCDVLELRALA
jgi:hypothetical protein